MAMPTKLTPQVQERVVSALNAGNYQDTAARYAGITRATFYNWLERGRIERERIAAGEKALKPERIYLDFLDAVENARANAEVRSVALIQKAANEGTWQAAAWFLERSHPQRWARLNRTEISGPQGGPIETTVDAETLEEKLSALMDRQKNAR
jgi:transposase